MSTSDSTMRGKFDELSGKAKQAFGDATGDPSTANSGAAQEVKGHGEQALGSVKEAAHETAERQETSSEGDAHSVRDSITSVAKDVKEHVENASNDFKNR